MRRRERQICLITGCRSGIGKLAAFELSRAGHKVWAGLRDPAGAEALEQEARQAGAPLQAIALDVTSAQQRESAVAQILEQDGRIDTLVNNAGMALGGFLEQLDEDELRRLFDLNLFSAWALTCLVLPGMRERRSGTIVNISSMSGRMAMPGLGAYAASKFALEGMSEAWRHELAPFGVQVVLVEPGPYKTDIWSRNRTVGRRVDDPHSPYARLIGRIHGEVQKRAEVMAGDPIEVARKVVEVVEDDSPALRHPLGPTARARLLLRAVAPHWVLEKAVARVLGPPLLALALLPGLATAGLQPDAPGERAAERNFDLQRMKLDVELIPSERKVQGTVQLEVQRLWPGPLVLDQVALDIASVQSAGQPLPFRVYGDQLIIELGADHATVEVRYSGHPQNGLHFREANGVDGYAEVWSHGENEDNRYWLPLWDHPGDRFIYEGTVRAPAGWTALTNAPGTELVSYLIAVAAGPYERFVHPRNPAIEVYLGPGQDRSSLSRVLDPVDQMMAHFAERTGQPYPWGPYRGVFIQRFMYGAMENTSLVIHDQRYLYPDLLAETRDSATEVVAHELAHHWFGDLLTCANWTELWLNEGFAEFFAGDWLARQGGEAHWAEQVAAWYRSSGESNPMVRRFHQGDGPDNTNVYVKGAALLQMARVFLGEQRFWAGIRLYVGRHKNQLVQTIDLQRALEEVSGRDLSWLFQQYAELPWIPDLKVSHRYADGRLTVQVSQSLQGQDLLYRLPVAVEVGTAEGPRRLQGWLLDGDLELSEPLAAPPLYVALDPEGGLLARVDQQQQPAEWEAQLQSAAPYARLRAAEALGKVKRPEALAKRLLDRQLPLPERRAAAAALGEQRAALPLLAAAADPHAGIRKAVAEALGRCLGPDVRRALERLLADPNPDVAGAALRSLHRLEPAAALQQARRHVGDYRPEANQLREAAVDVLAERGDRYDLPALLRPSTQGRSRNAALRAAARIALREPEDSRRDQARRQVSDAALLLLQDLDLRSRATGLSVLTEAGHPSAISALEAYARSSTLPEQSAAARSAIQAIEAAAPAATAQPNEAEARLKAAEERLKALEQRIQELEEGH